MAKSFGDCFCVSYYGLVCVLFGVVNCVQILSKNESILQESETIFDPNENVALYCAGTFPVSWKLPESAFPEKEYTIKTLTNVTLPNYEHVIKLEIQNISYTDVGEYICKDNTWTNGDMKSVYIYVNDEEKLSVNKEDFHHINVILTNEKSKVTFPCKPSHPDVVVELYEYSPGDINADYDPKKGFTYMVDAIQAQGSYTCKYTRGSNEIEEFYTMATISSDVKIPRIFEVNQAHNIIGNSLSVVCNSSSKDVNITWITPNRRFDETRMTRIKYNDRDYLILRLDINPTVSEDNGTYICNVANEYDSKNNSLDVKLRGPNEHFLTLTQEYLKQNDNNNVLQWKVRVGGHPHPRVYWFNDKHQALPAKYHTSFSDNDLFAYLDIRDLNYLDYGNVTIEAANKYDTKSLTLFVNVTDKPEVKLNKKDFYYVNSDCTIECLVTSNPPPRISWLVKRCGTCKYERVNGTTKNFRNIKYSSTITIQSFESGIVKCIASNSVGTMEHEAPFFVSDIENGFNIFDFDMEMNVFKSLAEIALGETLTMTCGVSNTNNSEVDWFWNGNLLENNENIAIVRNGTKFSNLAKLVVNDIDYKNSGNYSCKTRDNKLYKSVKVQVLKPSAPHFRKPTDETIKILIPQPINISCDVQGLPRPYITWLKNSKPLQMKKDHVILENEGLTLRLINTDVSDEASYTCVANNKVGKSMQTTIIQIKNKPGSPMYLYFIIAIILVAAVVLAAFLLYHIRKEKKLQEELKLAGLANFEKGQTEIINPELGVDEQADLLPYDKKWEFPIENLTLGKQLGSGAFGVVLKAEAKNIMMHEDKTTVAVKMVKKNADNALIKALASELKIMVHLGQHLNVVNLLGAVTKNVAKRELMVMVEYCKFGNLQNYLLKHRNNFVNQLDHHGSIDYSVGSDILDGSKNRHNRRTRYAELIFNDRSSNSNPRVSKSMADYRGNDSSYGECQTGATEMTTISNSEGYVSRAYSRASSVQPGWRSNYKGDYNDRGKPVCTRDLISYCFQITRGMGYLASRKVLHGDLAARNVLLAENNVVKICDFGLAKSMYNNENYKKKSDGPLPLKWMAIESIMDKIFSTQSDVWSFGVTAWEIFSLSRTPYPGMDADERLFYKLLNGYRMEKPEYASKEIYEIMMDCWAPRAIERPSFEQLEQRFGDILEETTKMQYIALNDPYMQMNTNQFQEGQSDYLAMMNSPTFENLSSPNVFNQSEGGDGYLTPTKIKDVIFDFNVNRPNEASGLELQPMLHPHMESDSETPAQSPNPNSVTNPSYNNLPVVSYGSEQNKNKDWVEKPYVNHSVIV
ncbi:unnamed protein product [Brassicogethes aeneus]|uniref:receptor protein-tyrosine kinase n=1 Tax=Brassicogethes aeneus TaxID=1431903 RepID=A0A9P0BA78_BRAAE|nr:unnamed protein product [Brassicogethes aeneus]